MMRMLINDIDDWYLFLLSSLTANTLRTAYSCQLPILIAYPHSDRHLSTNLNHHNAVQMWKFYDYRVDPERENF